MAGFSTRVVPTITAIHRRQTATRFGAAQGFVRKGQYAWFLGVHPVLIAARALGYSMERPHVAGAYFLKGWLGHALTSAPRCPDEALIRENGWARVKKAALAALGRGNRYAATGPE
jgi:hypothetical protein